MEKAYLPVGSAVELKQAKNTVFVIVGLCVKSERGDERDYIAVKYPMGAVNNNSFFFFDNDDIGGIIQQGYVSEDHTVYEKLLNELINKKTAEK